MQKLLPFTSNILPGRAGRSELSEESVDYSFGVEVSLDPPKNLTFFTLTFLP